MTRGQTLEIRICPNETLELDNFLINKAGIKSDRPFVSPFQSILQSRIHTLLCLLLG
jgi:hypothetical protein